MNFEFSLSYSLATNVMFLQNFGKYDSILGQ